MYYLIGRGTDRERRPRASTSVDQILVSRALTHEFESYDFEGDMIIKRLLTASYLLRQ